VVGFLRLDSGPPFFLFCLEDGCHIFVCISTLVVSFICLEGLLVLSNYRPSNI